MDFKFPAIVSLLGGAYSVFFSFRLRKLRLSEKPPASRALLTLEERQAKLKMAANLALAGGAVMLIGGI